MDKETILRKVKNVLEQVRPYLQQDGGDVNFVELTDDMVVIVQLTGACGNCPHSRSTLKNGIEAVMKKSSPKSKRWSRLRHLNYKLIVKHKFIRK